MTNSGHLTLVVLFLIVTSMMFGCRSKIGVELSQRESPSFKLTGDENVSFVTVAGPYPKAPMKPTKENTPWIWMILPAQASPSPDKVPILTYGEIPNGWKQDIPKSGKPPLLVENAMYCVNVVSTLNHTDLKCFQIKNGRTEEYREKLWW